MIHRLVGMDRVYTATGCSFCWSKYCHGVQQRVQANRKYIVKVIYQPTFVSIVRRIYQWSAIPLTKDRCYKNCFIIVKDIAHGVCILASGGTIWLLMVYRYPDGIKIDYVGTNRRQWRAVGSDVVFSTWFLGNNEIALLDVYPIKWCIYYPHVHTNTWNMESIVMFLSVHKIRGIKTVHFLTIMQLAATFQH